MGEQGFVSGLLTLLLTHCLPLLTGVLTAPLTFPEQECFCAARNAQFGS
jgi:hypothetical protein